MNTSGFARDAGFSERGYVPDGKTALVLLLTLVFGLWLDRAVPVWGQVAAAVMAWGLFLLIYQRTPKSSQVLLMSCLVLATLGEIFCSLIWELYDYRYYNIALYVPPGHVLVFLLGSALAPRMPKLISWLVPVLVAPYVLLGLWMGFDEFGIILYLMFLGCVLAEKDRRLYATMFMLCLLLEIYGTLLGNWTWRPEVQFWGLTNTNPPLAAGAFYCILDFLMFRAVRAYELLRRPGLFPAFGMRPRFAEYFRTWRGFAPELALLPLKDEEMQQE